jgi:ribose transport system substrate-binding protein
MNKSLLLTSALAGLLVLSGCSMTAPGTSQPTLSTGTIDASASAVGDEISLTAEQEKAVTDSSEGKLIGIVCATMATEYHKDLCEGAKKRAEELGFTAEIFDAQEDASRELQGFEAFVSKGAVAIIEDSLGGDAMSAQITQAIEKGITIVQVANRTFAELGAITVAVDNITIAEAAGTAAGEYAAKNATGPVQVALLDYPSIPVLVERADAIESSMLSAYPDADFIGRFLGGTADNGQTSMETALQANPGIQAVVGINDAGNLGAYQALKAAGRTPEDVFIFGIDCDPQAVALIDEGTMYKGCVDTNPAGTGAIGVTAFAVFFAGGTVPATLEVPVSIYSGK